MKITAPKVFATCVITALGTSFFLMSPLWVGLCFIIPGFSLYLNHVLKQDLRFSPVKSIPIYKKGMDGYLGCSSLTERKNKYGF